MNRNSLKLRVLVAVLVSCCAVLASASKPASAIYGWKADIPRVWVDSEITDLEVPLANPAGSPQHISAEYYYRIPVRPIYQSYPVYAPGHEPAGYINRLTRQEPEIVWGTDKNGVEHSPPLKTEADWIKAGEIVFDAAIVYDGITTAADVREPEWYSKTGVLVTRDGVMPFYRYVIRDKGKLELGRLTCSSCHTRVMPDGTTLKGAQGNLAFDRLRAYALRTGRFKPEEVHALERGLFAASWLRPDPNDRLDQMSVDQIATAHETIPPGALGRHRSSAFYPVQVPDLIGVKDRTYLDRSGLQRHRSIVDMMRYAALNQGADDLASFDGFVPAARDFRTRPDPTTQGRYSDEQLYALALYIYSLAPPPNPNQFDAVAQRGQEVFRREGCAGCHTPPLYTNNMLTPARGFLVPEEHKKKYNILPVSVGTDPELTLKTRRGTGYYKVPSLKGVWYRGPFEHSGSVATLEDWFDPRRLRDDYVPTGFKGYGVKVRAVKGHPFGLDLSPEDRQALLAFLRTL
ncbi:MAG TPA: di-heme oxidoredictase family protein [Blastocatellia bacterium]|nr:di-heme oxidoredictase family protein [Blastocatellia bacterium]